MIIGAMNHPAEDVIGEIRWMAEMGLEFIDLTLEPPAASAWRIDTTAIRKAIESYKLQVVGHTAYYLPLASAFEELRRATVTELKRCLEVFGEVGASWMNLHPDHNTPMHPRSYYISRNILTLGELMPYARTCGVGLMIENLPGNFNSPEQLGEILDPLPEIGLHLDIGHANLLVPYNMTEAILKRYGGRLRHVHLHDNKGGHQDLHLPLGVGNLDLEGAVRALKSCGYEGTITLEVFSPDRDFLRHSRDTLRHVWTTTAALSASR